MTRPLAFHAEHFQGEFIGIDLVSDLGDATELVHHISAHCLIRTIRNLNAGLIVQILERNQAIDFEITTLALRRDFFIFGVIFVPDFTNQTLHQIFHSHDAISAAVFIQNNRDVMAVGAHLGERR